MIGVRLIVAWLALMLMMPVPAKAQDSIRDHRRMCWGGDWAEQKVEIERSCGVLIDAGVLRGNDLAHVYRTRGILRLNGGRPTEAVADLEQSAALRPEVAETYMYLALAWQRLEDSERTINALELAEGWEPTWSPTNMTLGAIRFDMRDYDGAARNFRLAVRNWGGAAAENALCWTLAVSNQALDEAMEACNRAIREKPFEQAFIDSRALVKFRMGDYEGAEADYVSAVAMEPDEAGSLYGRGLARIRLGRVEQGRADIARAVEKTPEIAESYASWGLVP